MSLAISLGFSSGLNKDSFGAVLASCLENFGSTVVERLIREPGARPPGQDAPNSLRRMAWAERMLSGHAHRVFVLQESLEPWGRWDPRVTRALSAASGGFAGAMETISSRDAYGVGLFYAGRTIELARLDDDGAVEHLGCTWNEARGWCADVVVTNHYIQYFRALTDEQPSRSRLPDDAAQPYWLVNPPKSGDVPDNPRPPLCRIALQVESVSEFRTALPDLGLSGLAGQGWRWMAGQGPSTDLPFVMLQREGELDEALAVALARRFGFALGFSLRDAGLGFDWVRVAPDGLAERGEGRGAQAFSEVCAAFCIAMGETPDMLTWPPGVESYEL